MEVDEKKWNEHDEEKELSHKYDGLHPHAERIALYRQKITRKQLLTKPVFEIRKRMLGRWSQKMIRNWSSIGLGCTEQTTLVGKMTIGKE